MGSIIKYIENLRYHF